MEYLKRIETLEKVVSSSKQLAIGLMVLLGLSLILVPQAMKYSNPVLVQTPAGAEIASVEPWKLSKARIERFTDAYLTARFQWDESSFEQKRKQLAALTSPAVFAKLRDSVQAFQGIAQNQKARSYSVTEDPPTWDGKQKIEVHVTRILRIQTAALATPLIVRLSYVETEVTPENPYGLKIDTLDESQPGVER